MERSDLCSVLSEWRDQQLAQFARRAHRRLGRGFVLIDDDESRPVYVTHLIGAPDALFAAVCEYDPDCEALIVSYEDADDDAQVAVTLDRVRIESVN